MRFTQRFLALTAMLVLVLSSNLAHAGPIPYANVGSYNEQRMRSDTGRGQYLADVLRAYNDSVQYVENALANRRYQYILDNPTTIYVEDSDYRIYLIICHPKMSS